jgi:hypothetical protein
MSPRICRLCSAVFTTRRGTQKNCQACISSGDSRRALTRAWHAAHPTARSDWNKAHPDSGRVAMRTWRDAHPKEARARERAANLKRLYGLTPEAYDSLLSSQSGLCAICRRPPGKRRLAVDHDHTTGAVRALLCHACNCVVGFAETSGVPLRAAEAYILLHTQNP